MGWNTAALLGGMCLLPFVILNAVVAKRIEPVFSFIRPGPHTSSFEMILLAIVLACIAVGAFIAAGLLWGGSARRSVRVYLLNGTISALMLVVFVVLTAALGGEIYRCEVLEIPNCD